jgi:hypothetical protein
MQNLNKKERMKMNYYHGNKTNIINDLAGEIENGLEEISNELDLLENVDWNEIFENVPNSERIQNDIESTISNIRGVLDSLNR